MAFGARASASQKTICGVSGESRLCANDESHLCGVTAYLLYNGSATYVQWQA